MQKIGTLIPPSCHWRHYGSQYLCRKLQKKCYINLHFGISHNYKVGGGHIVHLWFFFLTENRLECRAWQKKFYFALDRGRFECVTQLFSVKPKWRKLFFATRKRRWPLDIENKNWNMNFGSLCDMNLKNMLSTGLIFASCC